jgi:ABC-type nitrate/sulfonate/bicarbonate transport system substrate-binding protein
VLDKHPEVGAAAVKAIVKAQKALKANPSLAGTIGRKLFPEDEAELITTLIERDAPFYEPQITREAVDGLMGFAKGFGLVKEAVPYEQLIATEHSHLWKQ